MGRIYCDRCRLSRAVTSVRRAADGATRPPTRRLCRRRPSLPSGARPDLLQPGDVMRRGPLTVVIALVAAVACGSPPSAPPSQVPTGQEGTGGTGGTLGQVDTAGVGDGMTTATTGF